MIKSRNSVTLFNIASTIILHGLAFFSGPIFSKILGPSNFGIAAVYLTWVQIAATVFSLQAAGTVALARISFPLNEQEKYQSSVLSLSTISFAVFSVITISIASYAKNWLTISLPMVMFGLAQAWGLYCVTAMNAKFTYEFKADKNFILSVLASALTIVVSLFLIHLFPVDVNYWGRIIGQSIVYTLLGLFLFTYMLRNGKTVYNKTYWSFTLPLAIPTIFHLLAHIVLNQSDKVMIQSIVSNSAVGIYALACTFSASIQSLWHALNNSWVPFYYEYTRQNQIDKMKMHARNYIELFTILTMGFILIAREIFHIYAAESFWNGTDLIPLFSVGYYFVFLYSFPVNYEFYNKQTKTIAIVTCSAAFINIILNYFFIKEWGIQGAVLATLAAHSVQFGLHYMCAKRINPGEFPFVLKDFIPGFFAICTTCLVYVFTREDYFFRWGLSIVLGCFLLIKIVKRKEIF